MFALTPAWGEFDSAATQTTCLWDEEQGCYILNGRKCFITMGPICDHAVVFAKSDLATGTENIRVYCGSLMGWIFQGKDRGKDGNACICDL